MPAHTMHVGIARGYPGDTDIFALLESHGRPEDAVFGVMDVNSCSHHATLVERGQTSATHVGDDGSLATSQIKKDRLYRFKVKGQGDDLAVVEVYDGNGKALTDKVGTFLREDLACGVTVEEIPLDIIATFNKIVEHHAEAVIKSAKVAGYQVNDVMIGPYAPRFDDNGVATAFVEKYHDQIKEITVAWKDDDGKKVTLRFGWTASFKFSTSADNASVVEHLVRQIATGGAQ